MRLVSFGGMGATMRDYLNPEFVLLGVHHEDAALTVEAYFESMVEAPVVRTTVETADLIKVAYNTFKSDYRERLVRHLPIPMPKDGYLHHPSLGLGAFPNKHSGNHRGVKKLEVL